MASTILEAILNFILLIIGKIGYTGIFVLMFFQSLNIPIPSEITMPFSGFLVYKGDFVFLFAVLAGTFGSFFGSLLSYKLASFLICNGLREKYWILKFLINDKNLALAERWFQKYGAFSIFIGRLIPVVNTFISFPAGLAKMKISTFSILTLCGSFLWSLLLVYLGFVFGENWTVLRIYFQKFGYLILITFLAIIIWWIWLHLKKNKNE